MADVYQIGISIAMQNGVSAVLAMIQKDLLKLNTHVTEAAAGFGRLKLAIAGATGIFIGTALIKGIGDLAKHGEQYTHQLELMKVAGMGVVEMQEAIASANKVSSSVMSTTPTENLETIRELRMALASADVRPGGKADPAAATKEAVAHLETFQKITGIMSSELSKNGKPFDGRAQGYDLAKAAEILGLSQDPQKFDTVLEGWTKAIISSGGKLQGADFHSNVKYMRGAGMGMSIEFLTEILPSLMQELKTGKGSGAGGGAGNPLASLFAEVVGGVMQHKSIDAFKQIHMLDMSKVHELKGGKVKLDPGAMVDSDVAVKNPYEFAKIMVHNIEKFTNYLQKNAQGELLHPGELRAFIAAAIPNRTAQQMLSMMAFQQNRIEGDRGLQRSAFGIDRAHDELSRHDPVLVREERDKQWDRLQTDLGKAITPMLTDLIYRLAKGLRFLSETVEAHPEATKWFMLIGTGIAATLGVLGSFALAVAALGALATGGTWLAIITTMGALGVAVYALNDKLHLVDGFWNVVQAIGAGLNMLWEALDKFRASMHVFGASMTFGQLGRAIMNAFGLPVDFFAKKIEALQQEILTGLGNLLRSLGAWFAEFPKRLMGMFTGTNPTNPDAAKGKSEYGAYNEYAPARLPPTAANGNQPGSSSGNPLYTYGINTPSGRDIAHGTTDFMGRHLSGPPAAQTGTDGRSVPNFHYIPSP